MPRYAMSQDGQTIVAVRANKLIVFEKRGYKRQPREWADEGFALPPREKDVPKVPVYALSSPSRPSLYGRQSRVALTARASVHARVCWTRWMNIP